MTIHQKPGGPVRKEPGGGFPKVDPESDISVDFLKNRAMNCDDEAKRMNALKHLEGKTEILAEILSGSSYKDARVRAAELLFGNDSLLGRALSSEDGNAKDAVLEAIERNQERAAEMAASSMNSTLRLAAFSKLKSRGEKIKIATTSLYSDVRDKAVESLSNDSSSLAEIASVSTYADTRAKALELLKDDEEALKHVSEKCLYDETKKMAEEALTAKGIIRTLLSDS